MDSVSSFLPKFLYDYFRIVCALVAVLIAVLLSVDVYSSLVVDEKVNARVPKPTWSRGLQPRSV